MVLVDANIILRYLLNDEPNQSEIAKQELKSGNVKILTQVVAEVIYVLSKVYRIGRKDISKNLLKIFLLEGVRVENEEVVFFAIAEYGDSNLDFVDELLYANTRIRGDEVKTFDEKLNKKIELLKK
ncbi:MAG: PIN domain-containing protein [Fibromonadales bacterium]|nr:PIN domain-containing protein [Fibromonadales bacterium]